ncbi:HDOD domain-containing protein [Thiosulfativibrio zosterae]|uniref:HDOD domain-containing protein n=1 Tax=Thiosulfativibrio zosterae TaxID=2675053 RepID=A0A6F8PLP4_9GAMM|nr:HDOD domain-containing protein [Thiosulfativibrio zosterae]BBP43005.1 HDOD domain-containing protein [Thiosulfativibrio zosterae]
MLQQKLQEAMQAIYGHKIPEIPEEILRLEKELQSKFPNIIQIANIIEQNATLSGEVIKIINSPIMKLKLNSPIKSIRDAVKVLGLDNIYNLVVASALKKLFSDKGLHKDIMDHSVDVAFCMAELSEFVHGITRDEAYMLGLFHNVGALMLAGINPKAFGPLFTSSLSLPKTILQKEASLFRTDHAMVGVLITKKWHLPSTMIHAIMLHHNESCERIKNDEVRAMVGMLKVANAVVSEISLGAYSGVEMKEYQQDGIKELMLQQEDLKMVRTALMTNSVKV